MRKGGVDFDENVVIDLRITNRPRKKVTSLDPQSVRLLRRRTTRFPANPDKLSDREQSTDRTSLFLFGCCYASGVSNHFLCDDRQIPRWGFDDEEKMKVG